MGLYRLKFGSHSSGHGEFARRYNARDVHNNVVESDGDLVAMDRNKFEKYEGEVPENVKADRALKAKFAAAQAKDASVTPAPFATAQSQPAKVHSTVPAQVTDEATEWTKEDLDGMSVAELKELAAEERVNLHGATKKEDIIKTLLDR